MKKITISLIILLGSRYCMAQSEAKLSDLKTPNSPGFQLLDISPSSIERPTNPKEFSLKLLNLVNSGSTIPKNFAFEFSPYWYFKPSNESVYKYLDLGEDSSRSKVSTGLLRKLNVSFASIYSDSTTGSLLQKTNYIAFGAKSNLLTIRTKKQNKEILQAVLAAAQRIDAFHSQTDLELIEKGLDNDTLFQQNVQVLNKLPLVQVDAAYAYSKAFPGNKFADQRFNRWGLWATFALNADFQNVRQTNHSLSLIFLLRTIKDNVLKDTANKRFNRENALDLGGKLEYNINRFSVSAEYVKRNYSSSDIYMERTVGILQYKVNDNLYIIGTYGKNFGKFNNVFTLIGLNWGFGNNALKLDE